MTSARERILDAYERQLVELGERGSTLDAIAVEAGVSKGGLLYHFKTKDDLASGLIARLTERGAADLAGFPDTAEKAIHHFIVAASDIDDPLGASYLATQVLARAGRADAFAALQDLEEGWYRAILELTGDPVVARLMQLVSDGIYYNAAVVPEGSPPTASGFTLVPLGEEREAIIARLLSLLPPAGAGGQRGQ